MTHLAVTWSDSGHITRSVTDQQKRGSETTVKRLMFACPLFREFHEPNKTAKLKGVNINCRPKKQDEITAVFQIIWF